MGYSIHKEKITIPGSLLLDGSALKSHVIAELKELGVLSKRHAGRELSVLLMPPKSQAKIMVSHSRQRPLAPLGCSHIILEKNGSKYAVQVHFPKAVPKKPEPIKEPPFSRTRKPEPRKEPPFSRKPR